MDGKSLDDGFDFFLKKDISSLLRLGVVIAPHEAYIDELVTVHYMRVTGNQRLGLMSLEIPWMVLNFLKKKSVASGPE